MFRITAETCRAFTLAEVLILAAMNLESARVECQAAAVDGIERKKMINCLKKSQKWTTGRRK
jgi:hypothetical protein